MSDPEPETQVSTQTWIHGMDVYSEPDAVLAHLRAEVETAEHRQSEQRVPGRIVLCVSACISTDPDLPTTLKG